MDIIDWARIHLLILQRSYPIRLTAHHDIISYFEVLPSVQHMLRAVEGTLLSTSHPIMGVVEGEIHLRH